MSHRAKRVSIHNNYFTFPVIRAMLISHPAIYWPQGLALLLRLLEEQRRQGTNIVDGHRLRGNHSLLGIYRRRRRNCLALLKGPPHLALLCGLCFVYYPFSCEEVRH